MEDDSATVWASTQNPFPLRAQIADVLGWPEERVRVVTPFVGGAFGGKNYNQQALEAARVSRLAGAPVSVAWSRREEFFLANLQDRRMRKVLRAVAERCGVEMRPAPSGRGFGLACGIDAGTYVAATAEVEVDRERGTVQVARIVCAQDMGEVINPEGATLQVEGCLTMGLGYALAEEVHFVGGQIHAESFDSYPIPRFSWVPEIEVELVDNPDIGPQGGGEPAIVLVGAVLANAIQDALGVRVYELPMTPERIRRAMAETQPPRGCPVP